MIGKLIGKALDSVKDSVDLRVMQEAAGKNISVGSNVYDALPKEMTSAPRGGAMAQSQGAYFLALAARRAEDADNRSARDTLKAAAYQMYNDDGYSTGLLCRVGACSQVKEGLLRDPVAYYLTNAAKQIEGSSLDTYDVARISSILRRNLMLVRLRRALPLATVGVLAVGTGLYWYQTRR
jgi:hypothetical protein